MNLRKRVSQALNELFVSRASLLLDRSDHELLAFDLALRGMIPQDAATESKLKFEQQYCTSPDKKALLLTYRSLEGVLDKSGEDSAIRDLEAAIQIAETEHIEAGALRLLAPALAKRSVWLRVRGREDEGATNEKRCKDLCHSGFEKYIAQPWAPAVRYALYWACGILEKWTGHLLESRLHFTNALVEFHKAPSNVRKIERGILGAIHQDFGDVLMQAKQFAAAETQYRLAAANFRGGWEADPLRRLAKAIFEGRRNLKDGRRIVKKALGVAKRSPVIPGLVEELQGELAWVTCELGYKDEAEKLYRELDRDGIDEATRRKVRSILERRFSKEPETKAVHRD